MLDLSTLNAPQREAVTTTEGPLLVLAGAGSGKTRVIVHRIAYLLHQRADPEAILAVTFTNKAAGEMKERVGSVAGALGRDVFVSTFHSFGLWLLGEEHRAAGLPRRFSICDASDQIATVKRCMREVSIDDRAFDPKRVLWLISAAKNALKKRITPKAEGQGDDYDLIAAEVFPRYQAALRAQRAVDFDDLIAVPVELLRTSPEVLAKVQRRFQYLLVDEYQDTNRCQLELLKLLAGERRNVCAVGDDDQAIYGWRGAEVRNILRFERHFPGAKEVRLEQNYRSTGHILACANAVIAKNPERKAKKLWTASGSGEPVRIVKLDDEEDEARFVASEIARGRAQGRSPSDFAVLYRLNAQSRAIEEALREQGTPYRVRGGAAFFDRSEVRDVLAYLKICVSPDDEISLSRVVNVPARGIGDASMERLHAWATEHRKPLFTALEAAPGVEGLPRGAGERMAEFAALIRRYADAFRGGAIAATARRLIEEVDLVAHARATVKSAEAGARKADGIDGVLRSLEQYEQRTTRKPSLATWLARLALDSRDEEAKGEGAEGVTLMTLHAAKGLEFPVVFLIGMEEDLLPCSGIQGEARDLDEERRLAYVGITRAREQLTLTRAAVRAKRGKLLARVASRFLSDLPAGSFAEDDGTVPPPAAEVSSRSAEVLARLAERLRPRP
ncbi:MAG TPA: UvrD-helicase domain-containing protein [Anaeromyxobacteraceae bacterium]|nr:UvrD-helicase domain-containing protein [Anaeromyxobacteraceae bacterium]